ncbi:hypothetical protein [Frigoribacterium sp. VKM Ac-2836]|uniref:hypothetical protein n=1 Tax=Frigoribacterium sp. VKM Ac-2836 TaxID=2739014 RepID=UPI001564F5B9|nr:hypothetical protein [Frigoribacterium sp. VKM Ac-2836]NRD25839.1 hypothetical protein [Frigoribacterium sp. VKM Ac-2836]
MTEYLEAGDFSVDPEARTVRGLLLPWGEQSRLSASQTEPIAFDRGTVAVPSDVSIVTANRFHDRHDPVGRATSIEDTEQGLVATFSIARTTEGDEFLDQYKDGSIRKLSAELAGIVREGARGIKARLTGAGFVTEGAFASAALFAVAPEDDVELTEIERLLERMAVLEARLPETPEPTEAEDETPNPSTEPATPATEEETIVAEAQVPNTATAPEAVKEETSANGVFELVTRAKNGDSQAETMLAALADIKHTGTGALASPGVLQPAWLGELWQGRTYQRKYTSLIKNGTISAIEEKGFVMDTAYDLVKPWAGNKTELPTGTGSTSLRSSTLQKWGFAVDVAREYFDLPGGQEVIEAFFRRVTESYARVTDEWTLGRLSAAITGDNLQAPDTYPAEYPDVFGMLIQGAEAIEDAGDAPSFAILNQAAWDQYKYTPKDKLPEFVSFAFGIGRDAVADGHRVVRGNVGFSEAPAVLVGSSTAAHLNEVGGASPVNIEALDVVRGGIDRATVGYTQFMVDRPESLVLIGADA